MGGAASSASKMTDALDNFVRGAGGMDAETPSGMDAAKVTLSLFLGERGNGVGQRVFWLLVWWVLWEGGRYLVSSVTTP